MHIAEGPHVGYRAARLRVVLPAVDQTRHKEKKNQQKESPNDVFGEPRAIQMGEPETRKRQQEDLSETRATSVCGSCGGGPQRRFGWVWTPSGELTSPSGFSRNSVPAGAMTLCSRQNFSDHRHQVVARAPASPAIRSRRRACLHCVSSRRFLW